MKCNGIEWVHNGKRIDGRRYKPWIVNLWIVVDLFRDRKNHD